MLSYKPEISDIPVKRVEWNWRGTPDTDTDTMEWSGEGRGEGEGERRQRSKEHNKRTTTRPGRQPDPAIVSLLLGQVG